MEVVGIRFKPAGKIFYFKSNGIDFDYKDKAIVNNDNEIDIGEVALVNMDIDSKKFDKDIKDVIRKATDEDIKADFYNKLDAKDALDICQDKADSYNLNMKIVEAEYSFDKSKLTFSFTANKRVDFRELVKDLAQTFHSRIELRQIGVRDHAKLVKHHGLCGQECCCSRHLTDFAPLSIKYAKDQNISLDPSKISGVCGRLMCCLSYEEDFYLEAKKTMPKYGQKVRTCDGEGTVIGNDIVRSCCKVKLDNNEDEETIENNYKIDDIERLG